MLSFFHSLVPGEGRQPFAHIWKFLTIWAYSTSSVEMTVACPHYYLLPLFSASHGLVGVKDKWMTSRWTCLLCLF